MNIRVRFASSLRYLVGAPTLDLDLADGTTLSHLFEELQQRVRAINAESGRGHDLNELANYVAVLRNGDIIQQEAFSTTTLGDGDVVFLVPPIAGGCGLTSRTIKQIRNVLMIHKSAPNSRR